MANVKISELNELLKANKAYDDYLPIVDTSTNETKKISIESLSASNVELLAVLEEGQLFPEPVQGARCYSKTNNKIYYAYDDEHWSNPQTPIAGIFYVVLEERTTYTYDEENETLVSVGGGGGNQVVVYPDEPTEDTKLYIEESDLDFNGGIPEDVYSTSEIKTNKKWIDGKSIYRKVLFYPSSYTNTGSRTITHNLGIDTYTKDIYGSLKYSSLTFPIPRIANDGNNIGISSLSSNSLLIDVATAITSYSNLILVLEYTKTN